MNITNSVSGCAEGRLSIFRLEQRFAADDHYDADAQSHGLARDAMDVAHAELGEPVALLAACVAAGAGEVAVVGDAQYQHGRHDQALVPGESLTDGGGFFDAVCDARKRQYIGRPVFEKTLVFCHGLDDRAAEQLYALIHETSGDAP